jgi:hypothetical protein
VTHDNHQTDTPRAAVALEEAQPEAEESEREAASRSQDLRPKRENGSKDGVCCDCAYAGADEAPCHVRKDGAHCVHWWDGPNPEEDVRCPKTPPGWTAR